MFFSNSDDYLNHILKTEELQDNPCSSCDGDCCGSVPFTWNQLENIFDKYSKVPEFKARFKAKPKENVSKKLVKIEVLFGEPKSGAEGLIISFQKKSEYLKNNIKPGSCIFKRDEKVGTNHCMIYEDRPLICQTYGRKSCACPYAGLKEQPTGLVQEALVNNAMVSRQVTMFKSLQGNIDRDLEQKKEVDKLQKFVEQFGSCKQTKRNKGQGKIYG